MNPKKRTKGTPPREIVRKALTFHYPERIPRDLWLLPWASERYPEAVKEVQRRFPSDFVGAPNVYLPSKRVRGQMYRKGTYIDEWGCQFVNLQDGVRGEVRRADGRPFPKAIVRAFDKRFRDERLAGGQAALRNPAS